MKTKFFLHQIKRISGVFDKKIMVKDTFKTAEQINETQIKSVSYQEE